MNDTSDVANWTTSASGIPPAANAILWDDSSSLYFDNDTGTTLHPQDGNSWAVISGVATGARADAISGALQSRWVRPYGAPAPEAGTTVSPFASGFELQAHYLTGHADRAVDLMEFMWADFMLDDPRMTNSTFIEGYSTDGSLHYSAYASDARVSYAHGWSTGPTSTLTFLGGGLTLASGAGRTWRLAPALGGLEAVEASYATPLGTFSVAWKNSTCGLSGTFETPESTSGTVEIPVSVNATTMRLYGPGGMLDLPVAGLSVASVSDLAGGKYTVSIT